MCKSIKPAAKQWSKPTLNKFSLSEAESTSSVNTADGSSLGSTIFTS